MTLELEQLVRRYVSDDDFDTIDFALEAEKLRPDKPVRFRTDIFLPNFRPDPWQCIPDYLSDLERRIATGFTLMADRVDDSL